MKRTSCEGLTIFAQKIIRPPNNKLSNQATHLLQLFLAFRSLQLRCISITSSHDRIFKVLAEVETTAKEIGIGEIEEGEVFG